jgi:hypothetical protein
MLGSNRSVEEGNDAGVEALDAFWHFEMRGCLCGTKRRAWWSKSGHEHYRSTVGYEGENGI